MRVVPMYDTTQLRFNRPDRFLRFRRFAIKNPGQTPGTIRYFPPKQDLSGVAPSYDNSENELSGIFSKINKLHKKLVKPVKKLLPKPLKKLDAKIVAVADKVSNNKKLNQVGNIAAAAVATYFTGGAAAPLLQNEIKKVAIKRAEAKEEKEIKKLQAEVDAAQANFEASASNAVNETLPADQQALVKAAYAQQGNAAFSDPNVVEILRPAVKQATVSSAQATFPNAQIPQEALALAAEKVADDKVNSVQGPNWWMVGGAAVGLAVLVYFVAKKR